MRESDTWALLRPYLIGLDPQRLEAWNKLGVPDVNCIHGWIELKHIAEWPKRKDTLVSIRHFRPEQKAWLTRRARLNRIAGRPLGAWLLLHVSSVNEMVLLAGDTAAALIGNATIAQIRAASVLAGKLAEVLPYIPAVIAVP